MHCKKQSKMIKNESENAIWSLENTVNEIHVHIRYSHLIYDITNFVTNPPDLTMKKSNINIQGIRRKRKENPDKYVST